MELSTKPVPPPRVIKECQALQLVGADRQRSAGEQHHGADWGHGSLYFLGPHETAGPRGRPLATDCVASKDVAALE